MRERVIDAEIKVLVVDGLSGRYRNRGRGVVLVALGVDAYGKGILLDWMGCDGESGANWLRLFRRLQSRGLLAPEMVVSDGAPGISEALRYVWKRPVLHQPCLWHLSSELVRLLDRRDQTHRRRFFRDYWEIFDGLDRKEAQNRLQAFYHQWQSKEPRTVARLKEKQAIIFLYYRYPASFRHRLRTTNLAEGFFRHLRTFLRRFPGWVDENHINLILGLYTIGMRVFRLNSKNYHAQELPDSLFNANFNRIL
jgi:transposase-like protein